MDELIPFFENKKRQNEIRVQLDFKNMTPKKMIETLLKIPSFYMNGKISTIIHSHDPNVLEFFVISDGPPDEFEINFDLREDNSKDLYFDPNSML